MQSMINAQDWLLVLLDTVHEVLDPEMVVGAGLATSIRYLDLLPTRAWSEDLDGSANIEQADRDRSLKAVKLQFGRACIADDVVGGYGGQASSPEIEEHLPVVVDLDQNLLPLDRPVLNHEAVLRPCGHRRR